MLEADDCRDDCDVCAEDCEVCADERDDEPDPPPEKLPLEAVPWRDVFVLALRPPELDERPPLPLPPPLVFRWASTT